MLTVTIAALNIHPFKSGAIQALNECAVGPYGLLNDRLFMTVDADYKLVSQRDQGKEKLALISAELTDSTLTLQAPGVRALRIQRIDITRAATEAKMHSYIVPVLDCGDQAAEWLTAFLGEKDGKLLRLVQFNDAKHRRLNPYWVADESHGTALADAYPILIVSEESLGELNQRIIKTGGAALPMSRFRPSIVLSGLPRAFDEDLIITLHSGSGIELAAVKPCDRCRTTTVDQALGRVGAEAKQPLAALSEFRRGRQLLDRFPKLPPEAMNNVFFGVNAVVVKGQGKVLKVGEQVKLQLRAL